MNSRITVVGKNQARVGFEFEFHGPATECKTCELLKPCMERLERNRIYRVVAMRKPTELCRIHHQGGYIVEVQEPHIETTIFRRLAIQGVSLGFPQKECDRVTCVNYPRCFPAGLKSDEKCRVLEVNESVNCPIGLELVRVVVERLQPVS